MKNNQKKLSSNLAPEPRKVEHSQKLNAQAKDPKGTMVCGKCSAVFADKHWQWNPKILAQYGDDKERQTTCPACQKLNKEDAEGIVYFKGFVSESQRDEMLRQIKHIGERATKRDPLDRIYKSDVDGKHEVVIYTTENQLAISIGKQVKKAFHGELKIKNSKEGDITRVYWQGWMG